MRMPANEISSLQIGIISLCLCIGLYFFHLYDFNLKTKHSAFPFFNSQSSSSSQASSSLPLSLPGASRLVLGQKININTASVEDLSALPQIGPRMAEEIVKNRQEKGAFVKTTDLMRVKGIKEKTFSKIKNLIEIK